ncbi:MAG: hypothetical protein QOG98_3038, partial [Pseudonocardiales bacterium]|nr:hypothetical protein [Pseudonocardiales bacterium]
DSLLTLSIGKVVGLNVTAVVDAGTTHAQTFKVAGGKTTVYGNAANVSGGNHTLTWTADSVSALPVLSGAINIPLNSNMLKSGAALKWNGVIHVTNDTAQCKIAVGAPQVAVSVGPVKVTVPPINVGIPAPNLPVLPTLPGVGGNPPPAGNGGQTTPPGGGGIHYTPPPLTVPEQAMGRVGTGGFEGVVPDGGSSSRIGVNVPQVPVAGASGSNPSDAAAAKAKVKQVITTLAANKAPAAQLPVLLAIIAIIALSLVTATYARLYMLRRDI